MKRLVAHILCGAVCAAMLVSYSDHSDNSTKPQFSAATADTTAAPYQPLPATTIASSASANTAVTHHSTTKPTTSAAPRTNSTQQRVTVLPTASSRKATSPPKNVSYQNHSKGAPENSNTFH